MIEPWQVILGAIVTILGSYGTARYAGKSSVRVKELDVAGNAYTQADTITKGLIGTLREDIGKLSERVERLEGEVKDLRTHNNSLIAYTYRLIDIIRKHGHAGEIPTPPPSGIYL